jgi:hypothetical protein
VTDGGDATSRPAFVSDPRSSVTICRMSASDLSLRLLVSERLTLLRWLFGKTVARLRFESVLESDVQQLLTVLDRHPGIDRAGTVTSTDVGGFRVIRPWARMGSPAELRSQPSRVGLVNAEGEGQSMRHRQTTLLWADYVDVSAAG